MHLSIMKGKGALEINLESIFLYKDKLSFSSDLWFPYIELTKS